MFKCNNCWSENKQAKKFVIALIMIILISTITILCLLYKLEKEKNTHKSIESEMVEEINNIEQTDLKWVAMNLTCYNPVKEQTDNSPLKTKDGTNHNKFDINKYRTCAVSPDKEKMFPIGSIIQIEAFDEFYSGVWIVRDNTNKRIKNTIDAMVKKGNNFPKRKKVFVRRLI